MHVISQLTIHSIVDVHLNSFSLFFAIKSKAAMNMLAHNFVCKYQSFSRYIFKDRPTIHIFSALVDIANYSPE